jgi:adenylate cyclase
MPTEIERKFLVLSDAWRNEVKSSIVMRQGYLSESAAASVRVRIAGDKANLNIKSATLGVWRREYEYEIPVKEAEEILDHLCRKPMIEKTRHHVFYGDHLWEIDVFVGDNAGLIVAEIELKEETEPFERPEWLGKEVSHDHRYYNVCLVKHPYRDWKEDK